jgi:putative inorganic carbon (hco3(-)) transporter
MDVTALQRSGHQWTRPVRATAARAPFCAFVLAIIISRVTLEKVLPLVSISLPGLNFTAGFFINLSIIVIASTLILYSILIDKRFERLVVVAALCWLPFIASLIYSVSYTPASAFGPAIQELSAVLTYASVFFIGLFYGRSLSIRAFTRAVALSGLLPIFISLGIAAAAGFSGRLEGVTTHPNILAFFMMFYTLFLYHVIFSRFETNRRIIAAYYLLILLGMAVLVLTGTRSAYVAAYLSFLCYAGARRSPQFIVILAAPLLALTIPIVHDRIMEVADKGYTPSFNYLVSKAHGEIDDDYDMALDSGVWRKFIWASSWPLIEEKPIIGHGASSFKPMSLQFFPLVAGEGSGAHSVYVQILFEQGIVGIISYACIWIGVFYLAALSMFRGEKFNALFSISVATAIMVASASDNMLGYLIVLLYLFFVVGYFSTYRSQPIDAE